ncbi:MAG TPA: GNAT family N-acetyltransferase [Telluria sp.]|jgi:hypothetical protein
MIETLSTESESVVSEALANAELDVPSIVDVCINERIFGIRAADVDERRNSASMLISKMYTWRGYSGNHQVGNDPNRITLTASDKGEVIGTLSLGLDSQVGLLADEVFKDHIDPYRAKGKVCEIVKLAIDPAVKSKAVLASLFHVAFIYARDLNACSEIFIEVNPRHRRFYESMLGFEVECASRHNPRVDAPAVLLRVNTVFGTEQIATRGGKSSNPGNDRSMFPYFFSSREEAGIINRLKLIG